MGSGIDFSQFLGKFQLTVVCLHNDITSIPFSKEKSFITRWGYI